LTWKNERKNKKNIKMPIQKKKSPKKAKTQKRNDVIIESSIVAAALVP